MIDEMIIKDNIVINEVKKGKMNEYNKRNLKALLSLLTGLGVLFGGLLPLALLEQSQKSKEDNNNKISLDVIKHSYICETNNNNEKSIKLLNQVYNSYYDVISNQKLNSNEKILSMSSAFVYFYNSDKIQNWYSQDELTEVLESFKINEEYTIPNVKVLTRK